MKGSVRFLGILLIVALVVVSWSYAQQAGQETKAASACKESSAKEQLCAKDKCKKTCSERDELKNSCKADCCKAICCKEDCSKSCCGKEEGCSMKSDGNNQCCMGKMHDSKRTEMGCCKEVKNDGCGKKMMEKKSDK